MVDLKKLVLYVVSRYVSMTGRGIGRVRLMKILFLIDYTYRERHGSKLTNVEWYMWLFGPFSKEVLDALDDLEILGKVSIEETDGGGFFYYTMEDPPKLDERVRKIVDNVLENYGKKPLEELLNEIYSINIVSNAKLGDKIL